MGGLVNESRTFAREVGTFLSMERVPKLVSEGQTSEAQKKLVYRHLAFCNALRLSLRGQDSWDELAPFVTSDELIELQGFANKPTRLICSQGEELADLIGTEVLAVIVISLSFMVFEQLGASLKNSFENDDNDTPMTSLCRTIEMDLRQLLGETNVPPPIEPGDGVLM